MRFVRDKLCPMCEKGNQTKSSFNHKQCSSITAPFHLLHTNFFSHIPIESRAVKTKTGYC